MPDLSSLFTPKRVAVIGATDRERSVGRALLENLSTFQGDVIPVNPNRTAVLGKPCYHEIADIPGVETIDLAIVAVPATVAVDTVQQAGEAGIRNIVVITAGFSESGKQGEQREQDLIAIAEEYDLTLIGPNCVGIISTPIGLNATFARGKPPDGSISLVSQSGAFITAVIASAHRHGIGFKDIVSLGNEAVVDEVDVIAEWGDDPGTDVILAYLEDIENGQQFIETAREVTKHTPVVVIKSGRTKAGAKAAASHTGSLAGSDQAYQAGFTQGGALRATNIQEIFDFGQVLAGQPLPERDGVAVVTNGGGPGIIAIDAVGETQLTIADFEKNTVAELTEVLPDETEVTNPLDLIGDADNTRFEQSLDTVLRADSVGCVVVLAFPTALLDLEELAASIGDLQNRYGKPVVTCLMGGDEADRATTILKSYGIPNYFDPARAVTALESLRRYREVTERNYQSSTEFTVNHEKARGVLANAEKREVDHLGVEAMDLLEAYGIPTPAGEIVGSAERATEVANEIDGPVVMKIVSPDVIHKSDIGGVEVGVKTADVHESYESILQRVIDHNPDATIVGVQIQEQVELRESTETIVGVNRDPQFGHLLMFGLGGIFVQIFEDTSFRIAPVSYRDALEMTEEIQAAPMLRGARGRTPADIDGVIDVIQRVSQLVIDFPAITELDINPLIVSPDGVSAIDFRLSIKREELSIEE